MTEAVTLIKRIHQREAAASAKVLRQDELCKVKRKKAYSTVMEIGITLVREVSGADHLGQYKPRVRASDFQLNVSHWGILIYVHIFKRLLLMIWRMGSRYNREKAWKENLWRLLQKAKWTWWWFKKG